MDSIHTETSQLCFPMRMRKGAVLSTGTDTTTMALYETTEPPTLTSDEDFWHEWRKNSGIKPSMEPKKVQCSMQTLENSNTSEIHLEDPKQRKEKEQQLNLFNQPNTSPTPCDISTESIPPQRDQNHLKRSYVEDSESIEKRSTKKACLTSRQEQQKLQKHSDSAIEPIYEQGLIDGIDKMQEDGMYYKFLVYQFIYQEAEELGNPNIRRLCSKCKKEMNHSDDDDIVNDTDQPLRS